MDDDLDTPAALAVIFETVRQAHTALDGADTATAGRLYSSVTTLAGVLGVTLDPGETALDDDRIAELARARDAARAGRDWAEADRLRDEIAQGGYLVEDTPAGTRVRRR